MCRHPYFRSLITSIRMCNFLIACVSPEHLTVALRFQGRTPMDRANNDFRSIGGSPLMLAIVEVRRIEHAFRRLRAG